MIDRIQMRHNENDVPGAVAPARSFRDDVQARSTGYRETLHARGIAGSQFPPHPVGGFDEAGTV